MCPTCKNLLSRNHHWLESNSWNLHESWLSKKECAILTRSSRCNQGYSHQRGKDVFSFSWFFFLCMKIPVAKMKIELIFVYTVKMPKLLYLSNNSVLVIAYGVVHLIDCISQEQDIFVRGHCTHLMLINCSRIKPKPTPTRKNNKHKYQKRAAIARQIKLPLYCVVGEILYILATKWCQHEIFCYQHLGNKVLKWRDSMTLKTSSVQSMATVSTDEKIYRSGALCLHNSIGPPRIDPQGNVKSYVFSISHPHLQTRLPSVCWALDHISRLCTMPLQNQAQSNSRFITLPIHKSIFALEIDSRIFSFHFPPRSFWPTVVKLVEGFAIYHGIWELDT